MNTQIRLNEFIIRINNFYQRTQNFHSHQTFYQNEKDDTELKLLLQRKMTT